MPCLAARGQPILVRKPQCSVTDVVDALRRRGSVALAMTVSGSLVQVNGRQRSFQAVMKRSIAAMRWATVGKPPRRRACRVMIEKNASTRFSHDPDVGVKPCDGALCGVRHRSAVDALTSVGTKHRHTGPNRELRWSP